MSPMPPDRMSHRTPLGVAIYMIRRRRGLTTRQIAQEMGMSPRSYERFEAARGEVRLAQLLAFAKVTDSDPIALAATYYLAAPRLAVDCADNKLMQIQARAAKQFSDLLGDGLARLDPASLISAFTLAFESLQKLAAARQAWTQGWLSDDPAWPGAPLPPPPLGSNREDGE